MGKIISIFDNQDRTRKVSLAVNLAMALAEQSKEKVLFLDLSFRGSGAAEQVTGFRPEKDFADVMAVAEGAGETLLKGYIPAHSSGVYFVDGIEKKEILKNRPAQLAGALNILSRVFPYIFVMLPEEYDDFFVELCGASNLVCASIYPQMISLRDTKQFLDHLSSWHFPISLVKGILNKFDSKAGLDTRKIESYLGVSFSAEIDYDMNEMLNSVNKGTAQLAADPHGEFSVALKKLAKKLLTADMYQDAPGVAASSGTVPLVNEGSAQKESYDSLKSRIHKELIADLGARNIDAGAFSDPNKAKEIKEMARKTVQDILSRQATDLTREEREQLVGEILDEALGLGCIEKFLKDKDVTEVMVNGPGDIYVEKKGKIFLSDEHFLSNEQLMTVIERIVSPLGRRVDESSPIVDARLSDGSRVNAIIPPLSLIGPTVTIRKFSDKKLTVEDLISFGALNAPMAEFLKVCVQLRKNIIVSGGTGSGKTTLLNVISSFIPPDERIVTIEDSAELKLPQRHVVRLESRPPSIEGKGEVPIRRLVINALRMRPDRIVVGECRGGETLDMLQAMNTGHDGSMTTIHANTPKDGISRITTMVIMAGTELPEKAIREQISSAVNVIVQLSRMSDGTRKIIEIAEVNGIKNDTIDITTLFKYEQTGLRDGKVAGRFVSMGNQPTFFDEIAIHGFKLESTIFNRQELQ